MSNVYSSLQYAKGIMMGKNDTATSINNDDITIDLISNAAKWIWQGREKSKSKSGILGVPGFFNFMRVLEQAIQNDDPYADFFLLGDREIY